MVNDITGVWTLFLGWGRAGSKSNRQLQTGRNDEQGQETSIRCFSIIIDSLHGIVKQLLQSSKLVNAEVSSWLLDYRIHSCITMAVTT